ncbi:Epoxide hydrolase-like,Alpha/beta hydrolase fold-1,Alpha/Beta hydrolase fold [Cinara cedri]|uniref:Epoxide hydrolase-like,Alpha/beta hydrolase fold-1,Alpha/Beta hydrolase fold n=1 Tax=Cinara cedri TaxID=506608 RepID=A0A5E4M313_9HEMI|nr:Epoxide hydrolase-like,Alpha/beta hydrolase fold-1,Alpha/Beta hydrolase fold [Cinara cedri]
MAVLAESRDNVVSISAVESLKMLAFSVIWGTWIVIRNAVVRMTAPLLLNSGRRRRRVDSTSAVKSAADGKGDKRLAGLELTDRPPKCLFTTVYGIHSYVKIKGIKFHYVDCGDPKGRVVLLLHGFPSCWISWHHQIPTLSKHFRVIAVDLKGFGDSDKPSARKSYRVENIVNELAMFLSLLGVDDHNKCHVIGHDLGALLGWYLVHLWPNWVSKFVTISCPHPNVHWEYLPTSSFFNKNWICFSQLPYLPEMDALQSDLKIINQCYQHLSKTKQSDDLDYIDAYKYTFSRTEDWTGAINYFRNLPFYRIESRYNSTKSFNEDDMLQIPCLLITGSKDESVQMESFIKSTEFLKTSTLRIIDDATHFPHQEQPQIVNDLLTAFLVRTKVVKEVPRAQNSGLVGRMKDIVSSTVQYGNTLKDSMQRRTLLPITTNTS